MAQTNPTMAHSQFSTLKSTLDDTSVWGTPPALCRSYTCYHDVTTSEDVTPKLLCGQSTLDFLEYESPTASCQQNCVHPQQWSSPSGWSDLSGVSNIPHMSSSHHHMTLDASACLGPLNSTQNPSSGSSPHVVDRVRHILFPEDSPIVQSSHQAPDSSWMWYSLEENSHHSAKTSSTDSGLGGSTKNSSCRSRKRFYHYHTDGSTKSTSDRLGKKRSHRQPDLSQPQSMKTCLSGTNQNQALHKNDKGTVNPSRRRTLAKQLKKVGKQLKGLGRQKDQQLTVLAVL